VFQSSSDYSQYILQNMPFCCLTCYQDYASIIVKIRLCAKSDFLSNKAGTSQKGREEGVQKWVSPISKTLTTLIEQIINNSKQAKPVILRRGVNAMKNKQLFAFFVVILIALALAACERSASTPPPEGEGVFPTLEEGTADPISELSSIGTQTAIAQAAESAEEAESGEETVDESQPVDEEPADKPEATQKPEEQPAATPVPEKEYSVPNNYTLQKGEFPYCLARRFNISPGALLAANGLNSSSVTYPGQTLKIPKDAGSFDAGKRALRNHPANYTVQAGDTVYSIACLFGDVDPRAIEDYNGLSGAYTIQVGQVLKIP
jgi:LysM repeat protein